MGQAQRRELQPLPTDVVPRRYKDAPTCIGLDGYVYEWCPTHPKAPRGTTHQHRLVYEVHLGRFLRPTEVVHHKNRDRSDNRLENLEMHESHSAHMREHWSNKGRRDPHAIELVRKAAADPNVKLSDLDMSPTTIRQICVENGIKWVVAGQRGRAIRLTEEMVREALQGRTAVQAARHLGCSAQVLYDRFSHLLDKRASPGHLDQFRDDILDLVYRQRVPRREIAKRYGVNRITVTKSIQRWLGPDAKPGGPDAPPRARQTGYGPRRKARDMARQSR